MSTCMDALSSLHANPACTPFRLFSPDVRVFSSPITTSRYRHNISVKRRIKQRQEAGIDEDEAWWEDDRDGDDDEAEVARNCGNDRSLFGLVAQPSDGAVGSLLAARVASMSENMQDPEAHNALRDDLAEEFWRRRISGA